MQRAGAQPNVLGYTLFRESPLAYDNYNIDYDHG